MKYGDATMTSIPQEIADLGRELRDAFTALVQAISKERPRSVDLATTTGIGKDISNRVLRATRMEDPLAVAHLMPGPVPLRRLITAASRAGDVDDAVAQRASTAVEQYEQLIATHAKDSTGLDVLISGWMPEVRSKLNVLARQSIFRGAAQLYGVDCETHIETAIIIPSGDGQTADGIALRHLLAVRRGRADARIVLPMQGIRMPNNAQLGCNLRGEPVQDASEYILKSFCMNVDSDARIVRQHNHSYYLMDRAMLGLQGTADFVAAERATNCLMLRADSRSNRAGPFVPITVPARELVFDVLVHRDIYPNEIPVAYQFDTARFGMVTPSAPIAPDAVLEEPSPLPPLGVGIERLRLGSAERYIPSLEHVLKEIQVDGDLLRAFRLRIEYPLVGSVIMASFRR